jgi:hypothetical protein
MAEEKEWQQILGEIRKVLVTVWDPINIKDEPNAQDEYDSYVGPIFSLLTQRKNDEEIADYLVSVESERMGLGATTRQHMSATVKALREIKLGTTNV